jgi:small subunit ribosomal protein S1
MDENDRNHPEEDFATLLEQSLTAPSRLQPGQKVEATVLNITAEWIFLDIGQKGEGVLDRRELSDADGTPTVREGDKVSAYFLGGAGGEMRFTTRVSGTSAGQAAIEEAWRNQIPVEGTVEKEIKGGYDVRLPGGVRAFCPHSQASLRREGAEGLVGSHLSFRITQYGERGRNIVVSHRAIVEEERQKQREKMKETLREGATVRGMVTSLQNFGAFVEVGGIEGLIPMSELGWGKVENVGDLLSVGQEVEVTVKQLDWDRNRFSFSLKEKLPDPWLQAAAKYPDGSVHTGRVARLAQFGAFITLEPGIDGLIHISRLGKGKKLKHPREAVSEGQEVSVRVESLDRDARRLSLVPADYEGEEKGRKRPAAEEFTLPKDEAPSMGTLGDLLQAKLRGDKKRK